MLLKNWETSDYKKYAAKWNVRAVKDDSYKPRDEKSADKINKLKKAEQKKRSELEDKAKANGWSPDKFEQESKKLQKKMGRQLDDAFGLKTNRSRGMGMGR